MGQIWGILCLGHVVPDPGQLPFRGLVHPLAVDLDQHGEVAVPHLLCDEGKVTMRSGAPAREGELSLSGSCCMGIQLEAAI